MIARGRKVGILVRIGNVHPRAAGVGAGDSRTKGGRLMIGDARGVKGARDMLGKTVARLPLR